MADEPSDDVTTPAAPHAPEAGRQPSGGWQADPRSFQRNLAERLFPGPTKQMSEQVAQRIENLLKDGGNDEALKKFRERQAKRQSTGTGSRRSTELTAPTAPAPPKADAPPAVTPDDLVALSDKLEQQNDLLRAILASQVDTQTDARSTAQNSRTFAWAGTAIGLLTLIATVIAVIEAIQGH